MAQYYYTLASLPMLSYDMERPIPVAEFLSACKSELNERDYAILIAAGTEGAERPDSSVLKRWRDWETTLRNELVRIRAPRKGLEAERFLREADYQVGPAEAAREAFIQDTPLEAEEVLNRARWSFLGELESGHFFDLDRLTVYYLRLMILHRRAAFDRLQGEAGFREAYQKITRDIAKG